MRVGTPGFVPERLIEAREARELTQTSLSELTGLKSQSISHYEQGRQSPSPEALARLCERLDLPQRYFLNRLPVRRTHGIFFRSFSAPARVARLKARRRLSWLKEIAGYVGHYVELPPVRLPALPVSPAASPDQIERAAEACRQFFQIGCRPLTDVTLLLESCGSIVSRSPAVPDLGGSWSQWDAGVPYVMLGLDGCRSSRLRFQAVHELGHLVMHAEATEAELRDAATHRAIENQADRFARAFLLPPKIFGQAVWAPTIDTLLSVKKEWNCPLSEMIHRCGEIGLFDSDQVRRALVNLSRRGWRLNEPLDSADAAEKPKLLAASFDLLLGEGLKDAHSLLADLSLNPADVEDLACLPEGYFAGFSAQTRMTPRLRADPPLGARAEAV